MSRLNPRLAPMRSLLSHPSMPTTPLRGEQNTEMRTLRRLGDAPEESFSMSVPEMTTEEMQAWKMAKAEYFRP